MHGSLPIPVLFSHEDDHEGEILHTCTYYVPPMEITSPILPTISPQYAHLIILYSINHNDGEGQPPSAPII